MTRKEAIALVERIADPEIRQQALDNAAINPFYWKEDGYFEKEADDINGAINSLFHFQSSPQGYNYWLKIYFSEIKLKLTDHAE